MATQRPLLSRTDVFEVMAIGVLGPLAWLTPERAWMPASRLLSLAIAWMRPGVTRERMGTLRRALGPRTVPKSLFELRVAIMDAYMEERLQILRDLRPGRWRPRMTLRGREHLDVALAAGHGAVLWVCPFSYSDLVTKKALHDTGVLAHHLSAFSRGFSPNSCYPWKPTRFGTKILSPLRTRVEDRYLGERVVVPENGSLGYLRRLEKQLRANGVVSLRAGSVGERVVELPFLEGRIPLATGAPSLALATGATLLPVFAVRRGVGEFEVVVEPPLEAPDATTRHGALDALCRAYGALLESWVLRHPDHWSGWYAMQLDEVADEAAGARESRRARA